MSDRKIALEAVRRLHFFLRNGYRIQQALEATMADVQDLESMFQVEQALIPEVAMLFAEKYDQLPCDDDDPDVNEVWNLFCGLERLDPAISDAVATVITESTKAADKDDEEWESLPFSSKKMRIADFLRKLSRHRDSGSMEPTPPDVLGENTVVLSLGQAPR